MKERGMVTVSNKIERDIGKILSKQDGHEKWLTKIEENTRKTNGSVAKTITDLALVKQAQTNCPARIASTAEAKKSRANLYIGIGMATIALGQLLLAFKIYRGG